MRKKYNDKYRLSWQKLFNFYRRKDKGKTKIKSFDSLFWWALGQKEIKLNEDDGGLYFKKKYKMRKKCRR